MKYLLDISTLLAAIWQDHAAHSKVKAWLPGKSLAVCPFTELGFLRISTNLSGPFKASMADARKLLEAFLTYHNCIFIPANLPALQSNAKDSEMVTDCYLADLASRHRVVLAT